MRRLIYIFLIWALSSCSSPEVEQENVTPPFPKELPTLSSTWQGGGYPLRTTIHLHSPFSHDACDGKPWERSRGLPPVCLNDLREGICATHQDLVVFTDHPDFMADNPFVDLFLFPGQENGFITPGERILICPDHHTVSILVGYEDRLMPLGLTDHVHPDIFLRKSIYRRSTPETVQILKEYGAIVAIPHTEGWSFSDIERLKPDVVEFGNHHAILDPDIRQEKLGLDPFSGFLSLLPFILTPDTAPEPDLAWITFYQENTPAYKIWIRSAIRFGVAGIYGCDAHQNVYPGLLKDGERGDSYRRMLRWATNWVFLNHSPESQKREEFLRALSNGSVATVFEALGTPDQFAIGYRKKAGELQILFPEEAFPFGAVKTRAWIRGFSPEGEEIFSIRTTSPLIKLSGFSAIQITLEATLEHLSRYLGERQELMGTYLPWIVFQPIPEKDYTFPPQRK